MNDVELRRAYLQILFDHVAEDLYPSNTMMDIIEAGLDEQSRPQYVQLLLDKVGADRFPSPDLMRRVLRLVG